MIKDVLNLSRQILVLKKIIENLYVKYIQHQIIYPFANYF